ncbi:MAG: methyl-accepting chemotaxis protein [Myxococcales bacterium]|jgi:methyl-accepting chemotaxis protein
MAMRQDTFAVAALADVCMIVYGSVFAPALALGGAAFSIVSLGGLRVLGHFELLPAEAPTSHLGLVLDLSIVFAAIPVTIYFLRARARISDLPYQALARSASEQQTLLDAVARLQPQVDALVGKGKKASRVLAAQAQQQVLTAENVSRSMSALRGVLEGAAAAAYESRDTAESTRQESSKGWSQLEATSSQLEQFRAVTAGIQASMVRLAEQSQRTEEIIALIHDIDEQLNVLALNASLEAARSGEAGRGFAVVASELRAMLRNSATSLAHGRELLGAISKEAALTLEKTEASSNELVGHLAALRQARETIERITESFVATADRAGAIAAAADKQQSEVQRVSRAMAELQESAGGLMQSAQALSESMGQLAKEQESVRGLLARYHESLAGAA